MGQVLHGCATTTEAVRRAIQHSQESRRALAKRYGINQKTVAKWKNAIPSPIFRPVRKSQSRRSCPSRTRRSSSLCGGIRCCRWMIASTPCSRRPASDAVIPASLPSAPRYRPTPGGRRRQASEEEIQGLSDRLFPYRHRRGPDRRRQALHLCRHRSTGEFAFVQLVKRTGRTSASAFLEALIAAVPYKIHTVLTDNGIQFAFPPRYGTARRQDT